MNLTGRSVYMKPTQADILLDKKYQAWCRTQPSALSGLSPCVYAHYNTAANAGKGTKAILSGLPLTDAEHRLQHQIGTYNFMPREWWEEQIKIHIKRFLQETAC